MADIREIDLRSIDELNPNLSAFNDASTVNANELARISRLEDPGRNELNRSNDPVLQTTGVPRRPFVFTCNRWISLKNKESKVILWNANPSSVSWRMAIRATEQKTRRGTVLHVWRDKIRGTYFDEPVLTFNLQVGNIIPVITRAGENGQIVDASMPRGLQNFYEFLNLLDEEKIIIKGDKKGQPNFVYIIYNSMIFPVITLMGFFDPGGVSFDDTSENPNTVSSLTASFTVYRTEPHFSNAAGLAQLFGSIGFTVDPLSVGQTQAKSNVNVGQFAPFA